MRTQYQWPRLAGLLSIVAASTMIGLPGTSLAQGEFPSKPIRLVVPFAAGGGTDVAARLIAQKLTEAFKQPVVVENRPGDNSIIGTNFVAKSAPDGYTVGLLANPGIAPGPLMRASMPYDPIKDFTHLVLVSTAPNGFAVRVDHPAKDLQQFIDMAKAKPGTLSYGTSGIGSSGFLTGELLKDKAKISIVHVPYTRGNAPMITDLMGGHIEVAFDGMLSVSTFVRGGRLRLLAVTGAKRSALFPDVPTMNEVVPGVAGEAWNGLSAPANLPPAIADKWQAEIIKVLALPDVRARFQELGSTLVNQGQREYLQHIERENAVNGPIIKAANIRLE